jgi:rhodanese-related sulfurtransferase
MGSAAMSTTRRLGLGALALGLLAPFAGSPYRTGPDGLDLDAIARAIDDGSDHIGARQLATWIRARKPGLRVIDVRDARAFSEDAIPTAENLPIDQLVRTTFKPGDKVVLYSQEGAHAGQAWVLLKALGVADVVFIPGGLADWWEEVMTPALPANMRQAEREAAADLSRYFGGSARMGESVSSEPVAPKIHRRRGC